MFKDFITANKIKSLKKTKVNDDFIFSLRGNLEKFIKENPVSEGREGFSFFQYISKPTFVYAVVVLLIIAMTGGTAYASLGSLPGEPLYKIKTLTEDVKVAITPNKKEKAKLEAKMAEERLKEINTLLTKKGIEAPGIKTAINRLETHMSEIDKDINAEKMPTEEARNFAKEIKKNIEKEKENLKMAITKDDTKENTEIKELQVKVEEAKKTESPTLNNLEQVFHEKTQKKEERKKIKKEIKRNLKIEEEKNDSEEKIDNSSSNERDKREKKDEEDQDNVNTSSLEQASTSNSMNINKRDNYRDNIDNSDEIEREQEDIIRIEKQVRNEEMDKNEPEDNHRKNKARD